jgi:TolB protein
MVIGAEMIKRACFLSTLMLILAACSGPNIGPLPDSPLLRFLERKSGQIAYIGIDGNVYTTDQGGVNQTAVTDDARVSQSDTVLRFYQSPTWSWDGEELAFVAIEGSQEASPEATLYVADSEGNEKVELFRSVAEFPFYMYWTSDDENIGFLTSSSNTANLNLRTASADGGESKIIDVGRPYYWSWSPDGQYMIVHVGGPADSDPNARLAFLHLSEVVKEQRLDLAPSPFQAPAWSPNGDRLLLAAQSDAGKHVLYVTDLQGSPIQELTTFEDQIAFGWSPDGEHVAYLFRGTGDQQMLGKLNIVAANEPSEPTTTPEGTVLAFFWSPDGQKVAYLIPQTVERGGEVNQGEEAQQGEQLLLALNIIDIGNGESSTIATFQPTQQFLSIMLTFDQYQHSNTLWSPDSQYLVLSAINEEGQPGIWVVPASGRLAPRFITPGLIAFWSWK